MKIAMIGHKDFPSRIGGVEVVVGELARRLVALGNTVAVYNRGRNGKVPHANIDGVEVFRVPATKMQSINAVLCSFFATVQAIRKRYDIIHFHAIGPSAMTFVTHLFRIPSVSTIHGLDWQRSKWSNGARKYLLFCEKILVRYADQIIVLTPEHQQYFMDTYGRETTVINNAIQPVERIEGIRILQKYGIEKDEFILYLGRLTPEKGIHYLIEAYRAVKTEKKLVIAGPTDDPQYAEQLRIASMGDKRIQFIGFVEGHILQELFSNCYLYVLPSEIEGMSLSLLEAMSAGANCLVSNIKENLKIAGDYAYSFQNKNVQSLIEMLEFILSKPVDNIIRREQIDYIRHTFDYDEVVALTREVYLKARKAVPLSKRAAEDQSIVIIASESASERATLSSLIGDQYRVLDASSAGELIGITSDDALKVRTILIGESIARSLKRNELGILTTYKHAKNLSILLTVRDSTESIHPDLRPLLFDIITKPYDKTLIQRRIKNANDISALQNEQEYLVRAQTARLEKLNQSLRQYNDRLIMMSTEVVDVLSSVAEKRDSKEIGHIGRMRMFTRILVEKLMELYPDTGITKNQAEAITTVSTMHDVGKVVIPDSILYKPGKLTPEEFEIMKTHATAGAEIAKRALRLQSPGYAQVAWEICRSHHERYDGRGYPDGLAGDEIPISAQIVSIADAYDALTMERSYNGIMSHETAYETIVSGKSGAFNPKLLKCLKMAHEQFKHVADHTIMPGNEVRKESDEQSIS